MSVNFIIQELKFCKMAGSAFFFGQFLWIEIIRRIKRKFKTQKTSFIQTIKRTFLNKMFSLSDFSAFNQDLDK